MRLGWYGHAQRLPNETPAKSVINYIEQNSDVTKLRGGQTTTWLKLFEKDLEEIRQHPDENINELLWNRSAWRQICNLILLSIYGKIIIFLNKYYYYYYYSNFLIGKYVRP